MDTNYDVAYFKIPRVTEIPIILRPWFNQPLKGQKI